MTKREIAERIEVIGTRMLALTGLPPTCETFRNLCHLAGELRAEHIEAVDAAPPPPAGNSDRECSWTVNGIAVNPDGPVKTGGAVDSVTLGTLREMARERKALRAEVARLTGELERSDLLRWEAVNSHYAEEAVRRKVEAERDALKAELASATDSALEVLETYAAVVRERNAFRIERNCLEGDLEAILRALIGNEGTSRSCVNFGGLMDLAHRWFPTEAEARNAVLAEARRRMDQPRPGWIIVGGTAAPIAGVSIGPSDVRALADSLPEHSTLLPGPNSGRFPTRPEFETIVEEVAELKRLVASIRRDEAQPHPVRNGGPA